MPRNQTLNPTVFCIRSQSRERICKKNDRKECYRKFKIQSFIADRVFGDNLWELFNECYCVPRVPWVYIILSPRNGLKRKRTNEGAVF